MECLQEEVERRGVRRRRANGWVRLGLSLLGPAVTVFLCQMVTLQSSGEKTFAWMREHLWAVCATYLVLLTVQLCLLFLTDRLLPAQALTLVPCLLLSIASYLKQMTNGTPLLVSDLIMAGQAGQIAGFLRPKLSLGGGTWLAIALAAGLLAACFFVSLPKHPTRIHRRLIGGLVMVCLAVGELTSLNAAAGLQGEKGESQAMRNQRLGLLAGLYSVFCQSAMEQPDTYSEDGMNRLLLQIAAEAGPAAAQEVKPNVILLMSESFFDPTILPGVRFTDDPVPNFHALSEQWPHGSFYSNTYAGGTGNVEMEIFTGIPSGLLGAGESLTTLSEPGAYGRLPSLARAFGGQGYETLFLHAYSDELYGRAHNIPLLGFDEILYQKDFTVERTLAGGYTSDETLVEQLIACFEEKEGPLFCYGLTMENHQPYFTGKFDHPAPVGVNAQTLTQEENGMLEALTHGLWDADAALGKLVDYFSTVEEPVILVFLGDHLPGLSLDGGDTIYARLGWSTTGDTSAWDSQEMKQMHRTDFLVWNNYQAQLDVPEQVSCSSLGSMLLDLAGVDKPLYFQWVEQSLDEVFLYRERLFIAGDGTPYPEPPEDCQETVARWENIVYDMLGGEQYITGALTQPR